MIKKTFILLAMGLFFFINTPVILADIDDGGLCGRSNPSNPNEPCKSYGGKSYDCLSSQPDPNTFLCQPSTVSSVFGKIKPPPAINNFLNTLGTTDPTGAAGIGKFLSNLVTLIYIFAIVVLIFMLLWGAFDWILSEGNKEKLQAAQNKIINAIIGILIFAVAFAIIRILGQFTGFTFFV